MIFRGFERERGKEKGRKRNERMERKKKMKLVEAGERKRKKS